jgi:hypothetical protein
MPSEGMRRSSRIPKEIAILLVGSDMEGKVFSERAKTVLLSRHGAGIVSKNVLSAEQELILRRLDTDKEAEVRVVGQLGAHGESYTYGVAFLNSEVDLWEIQFPPLTENERKESRVQLQCSGCDGCETVQQSDLESDVYLVNEGIVRFCENCGTSTIWKRPSEETDRVPAPARFEPFRAAQNWEPEVTDAAAPAPMSPPPEPESEPLPEPEPKPAARPENRRKHVRAKADFQACVKSFMFGEDIVMCEDISRGGLRFKSQKQYLVQTQIEVAAPYSPGTHAIFVSAQIVHVEELKEEKRFRCGVRYAKS